MTDFEERGVNKAKLGMKQVLNRIRKCQKAESITQKYRSLPPPLTDGLLFQTFDSVDLSVMWTEVQKGN